MSLNLNSLLKIIPVAIIGYGAFVWFSPQKIDFNTQIKPIINQHCIACHGGVKQAGGYSLLFSEEALGKGKSGKRGIIPFKASESEVIRRINSTDADEKMPKQGQPLSANEIELLTKWIDQGANWGKHWAYVPPQQKDVPNKGFLASFSSWFSFNWEQNDIDYFVSENLKKENLSHSKKADKEILLRRLCLDLIGLPPTEAQLKSFLEDDSSKNYEKIVDELMASPRFGEKWASMWLDLARYSDTKGYERDDVRTIWRYRDWLIEAFNNDMPYNQFLVEQLAGDLLPNPSDKQLIATAFHRNTMTNDEGGTDNEEFRTAAVLDRVNTTFEVLNSTTFACVQCHTHPYDPFRHEDYYKFMAFFNNSRDEDTFGDYPQLRHFEKADLSKLDSLQKWIAQNANVVKSNEIVHFLKTLEPHYNGLVTDQHQQGDLLDNKWLGLRNHGRARLKNVDLSNKKMIITKHWIAENNSTWELRIDKPDGEVIGKFKLDTSKTGSWKWVNRAYSLQKTVTGVHDVYFLVENPRLNQNLNANIIAWDWLTFVEEFPANDKKGAEIAQKQFWNLLNANTQQTPIMLENKADMQRKTNVFERGNRLVLGQEVQPDVPSSLGKMPENLPKNRLGLAKWMTSPSHPLTSRTAVNRFWEQLFGIGLVETLEDFGTQGFAPSNPDLLDFLAMKFSNEYKWSTKKLLKEIVLSATYQQSSEVNDDLLEKDPYNRFLARGPRIRLSAEAVRDQALAASGLLSTKMYGPGVMPYQPEGVWQSPYSGDVWKKSEGDDQYRRAVYTYHRRTSAYPSMMAFDGGSREICMARRIRTNTPLQALVTLNDPVFIECSKKLAEKMILQPSLDSQIGKGYSLLFSQKIDNQKLEILKNLYEKSLKDYQKMPQNAQELVGKKDKNTNQQAAMITVANTLLNLDEFITKQ